MATKKAPVRASRSAPARAPSTPKPAAALPTPAPEGMVVLAHHGGATLSFRDGSGAKRRVLRGVPFLVDAATADLLLATDPAVTVAEFEPENRANAAPISPVPELVTTLVTTPIAPADVVDAPPAVPAGAPESPPPAAEVPPPGPGAITLGDLPPGGRIGRP